MSYLDTPRLHFTGRFQADVSTVNNDVRYFDIAGFQPKYQDSEGGWNPVGTAIFRLVDCRITGARLGETQIVAPADDPVIGMALENADDRVFGKLVDLDPQQQMVSQIWGMRLRLASNAQPAVFVGDYAPTPFTNLWRRQRGGVPMDQMLGAFYQSVLQCVEWSGASGSAVLDALRHASEEDQLSIAMNVYGYARDASIPRYTLGRVAGTIGPYLTGEPKRFVAGRQMVADAPTNPTAPTNGVYSFQGKVRSDASTLTVDLGNSLQIVSADGGFFDIGTLVMAVLKEETDVPLATVTADQVAILGEIDYRQPGWYALGAGIQDFDYCADSWCMQNVATRPLLLLSPQSPTSYKVMVQESLGGLYVRADNFVLRLEPGATEGVDLHATRYGAPLQADLAFGENIGPMGGTGGGDDPLDPPVATPVVATPPDAICYPAALQTDTAGRVVLQVAARATGPGNPRGYIDGQLYGIGYQLAAQPPQTIANFWNFVSVLAFDAVDVPAAPQWYCDVQPILKQYGNLYPIMSKHLVQLDDYDSVVENLAILTLAFSLPIGDPNHMPVTRDLSDGRRAMILKWMMSPGPDGLPLKGEPVAVAAVPPLQAAPEPILLGLDPQQTKGKTSVMLAYEARMKAAGLA